ncbi:hypothetical protein TNCV_1236481 [Trichonephila clavipes]|nr:hypothetical protein TNCV_1236481 [Trichonephila clavipes]
MEATSSTQRHQRHWPHLDDDVILQRYCYHNINDYNNTSLDDLPPIGGTPGSSPVSNLQASKFESGFKSSRQASSLHGRARVFKAGCFPFGSRSQTARFRACVSVIKHREPIKCIDLNSMN